MPNLVIIPMVMAFDLLVAATVVGFLVRRSWKPLEKDFPARQPSEPSVSRTFQSFAIGMANYGWSIHVVLDDDYLHLKPIWIIRQFGLNPISIPLDAIKPLPDLQSGRQFKKVLIGKQTITGPKWCFALVTEPAQTVHQK